MLHMLAGMLMTPSERDLRTIDGQLTELVIDSRYVRKAVDELRSFAGQINDRTTRLEVQVEEIDKKTDRTHEKQNQLMRDLANAGLKLSVPPKAGDAEAGTVHWNLLALVVGGCVGSATLAVTITLWILHLNGKL